MSESANKAPEGVVVLLGHGSRFADANDEFADLVRAVSGHCPGVDIRGAFVELASPLLDDVLVEIDPTRPVVIVPTLLFAAGHLKRDVPESVARHAARGSITLAEPIGTSRAVLDLVIDLGRRALAGRLEPVAFVMVARGSSDPEASAAMRHAAAMVAIGLGAAVEPAFVSVAEPSLAVALETAARSGARSIIVLPFQVAAGSVVAAVHEASAAFRDARDDVVVEVAAHVGAHAGFAAAIAAYVREVVSSANS